ncbi:MAG: phosphate ABC transporter, permease protein PstA, partial [Oscillospiraceae bacterium]
MKKTLGQRISKTLGTARRYPLSFILKLLVWLSAAITVGLLVSLVGYILIMGIPHLTPSLFAFTYTSNNVSLFPALINTLVMTFLSLFIAVPIGIGSAIYLVEYAKRGSRLVAVVRATAETLSGIPSIVYGLFGYLFFVTALQWRFSLLAGAFTLTIMILPLI